MAYDFVEQVHFKVPNISESLNDFRDCNFAESHGLITEIAAIHEGLTQNFTYYKADELEKSLASWTDFSLSVSLTLRKTLPLAGRLSLAAAWLLA